jgi:hypothetical protein
MTDKAANIAAIIKAVCNASWQDEAAQLLICDEESFQLVLEAIPTKILVAETNYEDWGDLHPNPQAARNYLDMARRHLSEVVSRSRCAESEADRYIVAAALRAANHATW